MTLHVETALVKIFGNSVIFGDHLGSLPMIFQTILFYPDWLFMTWPAELIFAILGDGSHPYWHNLGPGAIGWSIVWYVAGIVCAIFGASQTFDDFAHADRPAIIRIPLVLIAPLLFWHIVIARMIGTLLTRFTTFSAGLSKFIERTVMVLMLAPPILGLTFSIIAIVLFLFRS